MNINGGITTFAGPVMVGGAGGYGATNGAGGSGAISITDGMLRLDAPVLVGGLTLSELTDGVYGTLPENARLFDDSTIRKKLKEYVEEGIVRAEKTGKTERFARSPPFVWAVRSRSKAEKGNLWLTTRGEFDIIKKISPKI